MLFLKFKTLFFVVFFILLFFTSLFAFTINDITISEETPYRIYIGDDKTIDWVDFIGQYNLKTNKYVFEDRSPIREVWVSDCNIVLVEKEKSLWKMYWSPNPLEIIVILIYPYIPPDTKEPNWKCIYKR